MKPVNLNLCFSRSGYANKREHLSFSTGIASLDVMLPFGGWPVGAVTEIFCAEDEFPSTLPLIWPTLVRLSQAKRWLALVAPPTIPSAHQLAQQGINLSRVLMIHPHATSNGFWAVEQALRAGTCDLVLSWLDDADNQSIQSLRGAALAGNSCGIVFRPDSAIEQPSAARLKLHITHTEDNGIYIEMLDLKSSKPYSGLLLEADQIAAIA